MAYNKYGRLPFDKLMLALREEIRVQLEKQTHAEILKKAESLIERRLAEQEKELVAKLRTVIAQMVLDPAKAVRELEAVRAGSVSPKNI